MQGRNHTRGSTAIPIHYVMDTVWDGCLIDSTAFSGSYTGNLIECYFLIKELEKISKIKYYGDELVRSMHIIGLIEAQAFRFQSLSRSLEYQEVECDLDRFFEDIMKEKDEKKQDAIFDDLENGNYNILSSSSSEEEYSLSDDSSDDDSDQTVSKFSSLNITNVGRKILKKASHCLDNANLTSFNNTQPDSVHGSYKGATKLKPVHGTYTNVICLDSSLELYSYIYPNKDTSENKNDHEEPKNLSQEDIQDGVKKMLRNNLPWPVKSILPKLNINNDNDIRWGTATKISDMVSQSEILPTIRIGKPCKSCEEMKVLCTHIPDDNNDGDDDDVSFTLDKKVFKDVLHVCDHHFKLLSDHSNDKNRSNKKMFPKSTIPADAIPRIELEHGFMDTSLGREHHLTHMKQLIEQINELSYDPENFPEPWHLQTPYDNYEVYNDGTLVAGPIDDPTTGVIHANITYYSKSNNNNPPVTADEIDFMADDPDWRKMCKKHGLGGYRKKYYGYYQKQIKSIIQHWKETGLLKVWSVHLVKDRHEYEVVEMFIDALPFSVKLCGDYTFRKLAEQCMPYQKMPLKKSFKVDDDPTSLVNLGTYGTGMSHTLNMYSLDDIYHNS